MAAITLAAFAAEVTGAWKGSFEPQMGTTEPAIVVISAAPLSGTDLYEGTVSVDEMDLNVTGPSRTEFPVAAKRQKWQPPAISRRLL